MNDIIMLLLCVWGEGGRGLYWAATPGAVQHVCSANELLGVDAEPQ